MYADKYFMTVEDVKGYGRVTSRLCHTLPSSWFSHFSLDLINRKVGVQ